MSTSTPPRLRTLCLQHLETLRETLTAFRLGAVCSADGFPLAVLGADPTTGRKTTAMAAALDGLGKTIARELHLGGVEGLVLECDAGLVLCRQVPLSRRNLVLLMVLAEQAAYGQALWAIKNAARDLSASLHEQIELTASQLNEE